MVVLLGDGGRLLGLRGDGGGCDCCVVGGLGAAAARGLGGLRRLLWGLSVLLHRVCCCGNWEGGLLQLLLGLLRLLRGGGGGGAAAAAAAAATAAAVCKFPLLGV